MPFSLFGKDFVVKYYECISDFERHLFPFAVSQGYELDQKMGYWVEEWGPKALNSDGVTLYHLHKLTFSAFAYYRLFLTMLWFFVVVVVFSETQVWKGLLHSLSICKTLEIILLGSYLSPQISTTCFWAHIYTDFRKAGCCSSSIMPTILETKYELKLFQHF